MRRIASLFAELVYGFQQVYPPYRWITKNVVLTAVVSSIADATNQRNIGDKLRPTPGHCDPTATPTLTLPRERGRVRVGVMSASAATAPSSSHSARRRLLNPLLGHTRPVSPRRISHRVWRPDFMVSAPTPRKP